MNGKEWKHALIILCGMAFLLTLYAAGSLAYRILTSSVAESEDGQWRAVVYKGYPYWTGLLFCYNEGELKDLGLELTWETGNWATQVQDPLNQPKELNLLEKVLAGKRVVSWMRFSDLGDEKPLYEELIVSYTDGNEGEKAHLNFQK